MKPAAMLQGRTSSDTCSEETDQDDYSASSEAKRSYDCTFCRRGFTNAQALGGHMNIHRKDKAKGKGSGSVLDNKFSHEELSIPSPTFIPQTNIMFESQYHQRSSNYHDHILFQPSTTPPSCYYPNMNPPPSYAFDQFLNPSTRYHQSSSAPNLSLQIGPTHHHVSAADHQVGRGIQRDGADVVVDLELRLGHHPC